MYICYYFRLVVVVQLIIELLFAFMLSGGRSPGNAL